LLIEIGPDLERARTPVADERVFSYRFAPDEDRATLFDRDVGWHRFQTHALALSDNYRFVLSTDISNFYPRVYHHRIENALEKASRNTSVTSRIKELLKRLSVAGVSYGLPVGGNAARMLAEALLDRSDRLLTVKGVKYCRFVDDYYLFADTEEEARRSLFHLSEILMTHEGLELQRSKTRLMTRQEFVQASPVAGPDVAEAMDEAETRRFLKLRLMYDPYSPTADEEYEKLRDELESFDVVGMLGREMRKSRIDEALVKQLVKSIRYLDEDVRSAAVRSLVQNLTVLYPIVPTVCLVLRDVLKDLSADVVEFLFAELRALVADGSHLFLVPANLNYAVRLLVHDPSRHVDDLLIKLYSNPELSALIKRDIILALAKRDVDHWVADALRREAGLTRWERRALIPASYSLGDEGKHWRERIKKGLSKPDKAFMTWVGAKNSGALWDIPL
jgi:hypothetical protein